MKKIFAVILVTVANLLLLTACGDNEYEFAGSRQGVLFIYDRTYTSDDRPKSINVAVDLYKKKVKDGYEYMVKSQEGNEYKLPYNIIKPSNTNPILRVTNFRHQNYVGNLDVKP